jgi:putative spermidine/putrescine transport system ATP-binding protein/spermidine/putrescine transport system ATP-binding protein
VSVAVELRGIAKSFGPVSAVAGVDLVVEDRSFVTLLGPSGCGKTTILRMIAGLTPPDAGDILIKGRRVNDLPIHRRNLGLVFQNLALFPHRTVLENVAYGLKFRSVSAAERMIRVERALEVVRLPGLGDRFPAQLSGGQQQRVALARAIVIGPDVLLLDEPLSSLDAGLREEMRVELKTIQRELGIATVFVTHDQAEALAMSDKIVVMHNGKKAQEGAPQEVYARPRSRFVAGFVGHSNFLDGRLDGRAGDLAWLAITGGPRLLVPAPGGFTEGKVSAVVRAERISLRATPPEAGATRLAARVAGVDYQGTTVRYFLDVGGFRLQAIDMIDGKPLAEGAAVTVTIRASDCVLLLDDED